MTRHAFVAGVLAAFVGFASSFAVVLKGLTSAGASPAQAASGLMALAIAMGSCGIVLSLWRREPISVAWSTPGAALLASSAVPEGGFAAAAGAFLVSGALIVLAGMWRPLGRAVAAIPSSLANAMLAGVLLNLCLAPMRAVAVMPVLALPVVLVWAVVWRFWRLYAVPAAVAAMVAILILHGAGGPPARWLAEPVWSAPVLIAPVLIAPGWIASVWIAPVWVSPVWTISATIGLALPLFLVTMASQNIPGMAVLAVNGFTPPAGPLFQVTGVFTLLAAPFGGHAVNLAAITAALCAGRDAHPDPKKRYWAAVVAGATYVVFGVLAGAATGLIAASPPILIEAIAGLALLGSLGGALVGAVNDAAGREAAMVTFLTTASGLSCFGIGGAFWGLLAGGAMGALMRWRRGA